jgi:inosine-uridine nucleoside N-ribohydrolase
MARPLLLDVDTGVDDAVAIALATTLQAHELVAVTTVAGNVPIEYATDNTLRVLGWLRKEIPVYRGASQPLVRPLHTAREHHGYDGLGGWEIPVDAGTTADATAAEAIIRLARENRGEITFVFVGPLTNLAIALNLEPRVADWVHRLVIMGGAFFTGGNVTTHAEFNIYVDPEAAAAVAHSGINATWVGLDVTHQTNITPEQWQSLGDAVEPGAVLVREVTRRTLVELGRPTFHLHDPLAVAIAELPGIAAYEHGGVTIDTTEHYRGTTRLSAAVGTDIASQVARSVDQQAFDSVLRHLVTR